jgi:hypothetical protein
MQIRVPIITIIMIVYVNDNSGDIAYPVDL